MAGVHVISLDPPVTGGVFQRQLGGLRMLALEKGIYIVPEEFQVQTHYVSVLGVQRGLLFTSSSPW